MKALTLYQPWASLVALGEKKIETRSWAPKNYRGPLAIHAAMLKPSSIWKDVEPIVDEARAVLGIVDLDTLPRGCIIAVCNLVDCQKVVSRALLKNKPLLARLEDETQIEGNELTFGNYMPGRFAWILEDIRPLPEPIPAKGAQRIWNWEVPPGTAI